MNKGISKQDFRKIEEVYSAVRKDLEQWRCDIGEYRGIKYVPGDAGVQLGALEVERSSTRFEEGLTFGDNEPKMKPKSAFLPSPKADRMNVSGFNDSSI